MHSIAHTRDAPTALSRANMAPPLLPKQRVWMFRTAPPSQFTAVKLPGSAEKSQRHAHLGTSVTAVVFWLVSVAEGVPHNAP
jgi:hypothetical protein